MLGLKPEILWKHFEEISKIPRQSGKEERVGNHILEFSRKLGYFAKRDEAGNILIEVPASKGKENSEIIVLQCHLDMVCEKNEGVNHDFEKDPIKLKIVNGWVMADGTSLGADNGIGVAACLALMEEKDFIRGPLEILFTVDEETGLNGAFSLSPDFIKGRKLINLDSEEEGVIYIGCAGGKDTILRLKIKRKKEKRFDKTFKISIKGLKGGHSGVDIHLGRANANQLLVRLLKDLSKDKDYEIYEINGGSKRNAIPREAFCILGLNENIENFIKNENKIFSIEYGKIDPELKIEISEENTNLMPFEDKSKEKVINLLYSIPHGVLKYSFEIEGLVETSTNFAIITTKENEIEIATSQRSSIESGLEWASNIIEGIGKISKAKIEKSKGYPGWKPELNSLLLKKVTETFEKTYGKKPEYKAIHAGLECGIIGKHYEGMDMVSIGPQIENVHSPSERVNIASVERFYNFLKNILSDLA